MKRIIWMLLVVSAVVQPLSSTGSYMLSQANRSYTASHPCAPRQGTCSLQQQAGKVARPEQQEPLPQKQLTLHLASTRPNRWAASTIPGSATLQRPSHHSMNAVIFPCFSIFHPPWLMS